MRAFLALPLPEPLRQALAREAAGIEGLKAQKPGTIHLTIRFLGDIGDTDAVVRAVRPVVEASEPFEMELEGLGAFPGPRKARVVWVGIGKGAAEAAGLAAGVDRALSGIGIPPEERPWRAHVTLGRFRSPRAFLPDDEQGARVFGIAPARALVLFRSTLTPSGAVHEPVESLSLGGGM